MPSGLIRLWRTEPSRNLRRTTAAGLRLWKMVSPNTAPRRATDARVARFHRGPPRSTLPLMSAPSIHSVIGELHISFDLWPRLQRAEHPGTD